MGYRAWRAQGHAIYDRAFGNNLLPRYCNDVAVTFLRLWILMLYRPQRSRDGTKLPLLKLFFFLLSPAYFFPSLCTPPKGWIQFLHRSWKNSWDTIALRFLRFSSCISPISLQSMEPIRLYFILIKVESLFFGFYSFFSLTFVRCWELSWLKCTAPSFSVHSACKFRTATRSLVLVKVHAGCETDVSR